MDRSSAPTTTETAATVMLSENELPSYKEFPNDVFDMRMLDWDCRGQRLSLKCLVMETVQCTVFLTATVIIT